MVSNAPRTCPTPVAVSASSVSARVDCWANSAWPQARAKPRLGRKSRSTWYVARPPARIKTSASTNFSLGRCVSVLIGNANSNKGSSTPARRSAYPNTARGTCFILPVRLSVIGMRAMRHLLNVVDTRLIQAPNHPASIAHISPEIRPIYEPFFSHRWPQFRAKIKCHSEPGLRSVEITLPVGR
jgi:hypothetical protein